MAITFSINLNVTPLTDNTVAFANAAAWNNYFNDLSADATLTPIDVTGYSAVSYNSALTPHSLTVGSDTYIFPTQDMFTSLLNAYQNLAANYAILRGELYAAGLIDAP